MNDKVRPLISNGREQGRIRWRANGGKPTVMDPDLHDHACFPLRRCSSHIFVDIVMDKFSPSSTVEDKSVSPASPSRRSPGSPPKLPQVFLPPSTQRSKRLPGTVLPSDSLPSPHSPSNRDGKCESASPNRPVDSPSVEASPNVRDRFGESGNRANLNDIDPIAIHPKRPMNPQSVVDFNPYDNADDESSDTDYGIYLKQSSPGTNRPNDMRSAGKNFKQPDPGGDQNNFIGQSTRLSGPLVGPQPDRDFDQSVKGNYWKELNPRVLQHEEPGKRYYWRDGKFVSADGCPVAAWPTLGNGKSLSSREDNYNYRRPDPSPFDTSWERAQCRSSANTWRPETSTFEGGMRRASWDNSEGCEARDGRERQDKTRPVSPGKYEAPQWRNEARRDDRKRTPSPTIRDILCSNDRGEIVEPAVEGMVRAGRRDSTGRSPSPNSRDFFGRINRGEAFESRGEGRVRVGNQQALDIPPLSQMSDDRATRGWRSEDRVDGRPRNNIPTFTEEIRTVSPNLNKSNEWVRNANPETRFDEGGGLTGQEALDVLTFRMENAPYTLCQSRTANAYLDERSESSDPTYDSERTPFGRLMVDDYQGSRAVESSHDYSRQAPATSSSGTPKVGRRFSDMHTYVSGYVVKGRKQNRHIPVTSNTMDQEDTPRGGKSSVVEVGDVDKTFCPQPGDILLIHSHRLSIPFPGFDGHVELYVDEDYFINRSYTPKSAYDFEYGDLIIRFGRFSALWRWSQEDEVKVYQFFGGENFVLIGREMSRELYPLDFRFSDPGKHTIHSVRADFQPRRGDLIGRKSEEGALQWKLLWWEEGFYRPRGFDVLVRASFQNSDDRIHSFGMAEVYFRDEANEKWKFHGRDDYTFGGGP